MDELLPAIEIKTASASRFYVIWLLGLGAEDSSAEMAIRKGVHHAD